MKSLKKFNAENSFGESYSLGLLYFDNFFYPEAKYYLEKAKFFCSEPQKKEEIDNFLLKLYFAKFSPAELDLMISEKRKKGAGEIYSYFLEGYKKYREKNYGDSEKLFKRALSLSTEESTKLDSLFYLLKITFILEKYEETKIYLELLLSKYPGTFQAVEAEKYFFLLEDSE